MEITKEKVAKDLESIATIQIDKVVLNMLVTMSAAYLSNTPDVNEAERVYNTIYKQRKQFKEGLLAVLDEIEKDPELTPAQKEEQSLAIKIEGGKIEFGFQVIALFFDEAANSIMMSRMANNNNDYGKN